MREEPERGGRSPRGRDWSEAEIPRGAEEGRWRRKIKIQYINTRVKRGKTRRERARARDRGKTPKGEIPRGMEGVLRGNHFNFLFVIQHINIFLK